MPDLKGTIKSVVFRNEDNDYHIIKIVTDDDKIETVTGYFPPLSDGVLYAFTGDYVTHQKYGLQFKAETIKRLDYDAGNGLVAYLSSHLFSGIGPKTAEKIVELLGVDAIDKIIENPRVLTPVGLSFVRMLKLSQELKKHKLHEVMLVTLYSYGLTSKMAMKLIQAYGDQTIEKLKENPYRLAEEVEGIGFVKADLIAKQMGIEDNDERRVMAAIMYTFEHRGFQQGDTYLLLDQLELHLNQKLHVNVDMMPFLERLISAGKIKEVEGKYALSVAYFSANKLATKIKSIMVHQHQVDDELEGIVERIEVKKHFRYTQVQKEAIVTALASSLSIITGGPGTGKTTIIDGILEVYLTMNKLSRDDHEVQDLIALMAPTGRAAKRMRDVLGFPAKTIHSTLGYSFDGSFGFNQFSPLPQKLIIIDEASMIDLFLANKLFDAIQDDAQVIIVGDVDQLPSVGPGQCLEDIISMRICPVVQLNQIHRQAAHSQIIKLSQKVNQMEVAYEDVVTSDDVFVYKCYTNQLISTVIHQVRGAIKQGYSIHTDIQVLIPVYKGDVGIDMFNKKLQEAFNDTSQVGMTYGDKTYYVGDKVIQLVNDPKLGIMNGDVGIIKYVRKNMDGHWTLTVNYDGNDVVYDKGDLDQLNLAYAMSIHKAQGSEYDIVIMPLVKSYTHMFKKELIYTAMTRAKTTLLLLGDISMLIYASNHQNEKRQTLLPLFFGDEPQDDKTSTLSPYDFM